MRREKKSVYQISKLDDLISSVKDQKTFWSEVNALTRRSCRNGNIYSEEWLRHFESSFHECVVEELDGDNNEFNAEDNLDDVQKQFVNCGYY